MTRRLNLLLHESDACLELLEQAILTDMQRVPRQLRDRVARLAKAAGHRPTRPPLDPGEAHEFVFDLQDEYLLPGGPREKPAVASPRPKRAPRTAQRDPLFGSADWLETRRSMSLARNPDWAWEVWREAADLARLQPTAGRVAAMQEAWAYYWALLDVGDESVERARRAA